MTITNWTLEHVACPLCHKDDCKTLGIRGNREYDGADPKATPHIQTNVVQCNNCDFIYTNPMIRGVEHLERDHYNNPVTYLSDNPEVTDEMFQNRIEFLEKKTDKRTLFDVGAGKGEFLFFAKQRGWNVSGIEPSIEFCKYAQTSFDIQLQNGYLKDHTAGSPQYDIISLNHVLEHVDEPINLLKQIGGHLTDKGYLFIEVPNCGATLLRLADIYFKWKGLNWSSRLSPLHAPFHKYGYTSKSLTYALNQSGYRVVEVKTFSGKERYAQGKKTTLSTIRNFINRVIDLFDNRELLVVLAQKK